MKSARHAFAATLMTTVLVGACSSNKKHPPELGDCVPTQDASCDKPITGGSAGPPPIDAGAQDTGTDAGSGSTADGNCGLAGNALTTSNIYCLPCVNASCCTADTACSDDPGCMAIVQCAQNCQQGDTACVTLCEQSVSATSVPTYNDFGACLRQNCNPQCPILPSGGTRDL